MLCLQCLVSVSFSSLLLFQSFYTGLMNLSNMAAFSRSEVAASMLSWLPSSGNLTRIPRLIKTVYHVGDRVQAFSTPIYKTCILDCTSNKTCTPTPT